MKNINLINELNLNQYNICEFKIDINELGKYLDSYKVFSNNEVLVNYHKEILNLQKDIDKKEKYINLKKGVGICIITSLWNAFPKLFDNDKKNVLKMLKKIKPDINNIPKIIHELNKKFNCELLKQIVDINENIFNKIKANLDQNMPVIACYESSYINHAINIFGYNDDSFIYFENGNDSLVDSVTLELFQKLNFYMNYGRKLFKDSKLEWYYDFRLNHTDNKECYNFLKNGIYYKINELSYIRKDCFISIVKNINLIEINKEKCNIDFSSLIKRLKQITSL